MEFLNEVWDTLKEIAESKMKKIFDGQRDNKGQLDYGGSETFYFKYCFRNNVNGWTCLSELKPFPKRLVRIVIKIFFVCTTRR